MCGVQGRRCVLKDCCKILDNTVLPPETVVPPFTVFSGCPGQPHSTSTLWTWPTSVMCLPVLVSPSRSGLFSGELPECTQDLMIDVTKSYYQKFLPLSQIWVLPRFFGSIHPVSSQPVCISKQTEMDSKSSSSIHPLSFRGSWLSQAKETQLTLFGALRWF